VLKRKPNERKQSSGRSGDNLAFPGGIRLSQGLLPVCEAWFEFEDFETDLFRITEPHIHALIRANAWLLLGRDRDLLVDVGSGLMPLLPYLQKIRPSPGKPLVALATHAHMDHIGGLHEFGERLFHSAEASGAAAPDRLLWRSDIWPPVREQMAEAGMPLPELLISAVPERGFDPKGFRSLGVAPTRTVGEGDRIDLGDRSFRVLHLPGHTPGSIGLWSDEKQVLFGGDAVYATEPLIDTAPTSDIASYVRTMRRLRELPAEIVHPGHDYSFDRGTLIRRCDSYLSRRAPREHTVPPG
jgi:glyoxylase-like metal-dependent hydrolase (beta-lactamase superfamily II)